jgi:hypothetical protein
LKIMQIGREMIFLQLKRKKAEIPSGPIPRTLDKESKALATSSGEKLNCEERELLDFYVIKSSIRTLRISFVSRGKEGSE